MSFKDKTLLNVLVWLCVYPAVLAVTYGFRWMEIEMALWLEIGLSTLITVPLISAVAIPQVERMVAAASDRTHSQLKVDQAREATGPSPERILDRGSRKP